MIDPKARATLHERVRQVRDGELQVRYFVSQSPPRSRDPAIRRIFDELARDLQIRIPLSPAERSNELPPDVIRQLDRVLLFLASDLEYQPSKDERWNCSGWSL